MDEMRIVSGFTRWVVSRIINVMLKKKLGYDVDIQVNEAAAIVNDGKTHLHLDIDATMERDELIKILKKAGLN